MLMLLNPRFIAISAASLVVVAADSLTPEGLAAKFSLTTSTTLPFPTATASTGDAQSLMTSQWSLSKGRIQNGAGDLAFVEDPFPNNPASGSPASTGPVLEVTYPAGSFSGDTGGAQFINLWNTTESGGFQSMLISYEVAFDQNYDWVKGGKLPGLRGGKSATGCSGGNESTGLDCFSTRMMWRTNGQGEAYAYIPSPNNLCSEKDVICNDDFGISLSRGSFSFKSGQWNHVSLLVQLNNPVDVANGNIEVYFNNVQAFAQSDLQIRASDSVTVGGLYFSTFFGGSDSSWSTPDTTHTYFRNMELYGSSNPSTLTGSKVTNSGISLSPVLTGVFTALFFVLTL
ncbi:polysaccharide lyase family 14 protein [Mycena albidolilacea]|uniref:Polysaccharide lyase family 14 protein n=1 Tax=Mycena albidolilacea TaxID=1033008 RepID=A0AAD7ES18_9AGAR|nr:polysaccharide lyase family 14 protein [Mycena albidolilacea]